MEIIDYTKFRLKPPSEILECLKDKNNVILFLCRKCYREFTDDKLEECDELSKILTENNKKILYCIGLDFLCNSYLNKKIIAKTDLKDADSVGVSGCGIGIQFISEEIDTLPVFAMADSIPQAGNATCLSAHHGIALYQKKCSACAQCYLNSTAGICPVVDCSKSLLNGSCGGAKGGKCEVKGKDGSTRDCAWEKIYSLVSRQNRLKTHLEEPVQIRNYSKPGFTAVNTHINANIEKRTRNFYGGLYPFEKKEITENKPIEPFPEPDFVVIPLSQHAGPIHEPLVKTGEYVKVGQKLGDLSHQCGFFSVPVHSSVSGRVTSIEERLHPLMQKKVKSVVIENDRKNELHESVKPAANYESLSPDDLLNIIHEKGIVGMGGAMFPTYVKLKPKKRVDTLIVNGVECEPYLTADYRVMLERSKDIIDGIKIVAKILGVDKAIIAIEDNKKEAVGKFMDLAVELPTKYPQGAEKMLIKKVLGREVPPGGLPMDVGVVVSNVSTILAISDAVIKGIPLYKRVITVSGVTAPRPGNYEVKIGTPLQNIVNYCFSNYSSLFTVHCLLKMGGPMMGIPQADLSAPVIKGTTGLVAVKKSEIEYTSARNCIKCGRCVDVCPMELYPLYFAMYSSRDNLKELCNYNVKQCIECGCCEYICSSKIPLVGLAKKAKQLC